MNALEAFAACRSRAMVRRTIITAENRLTPEEVVALHARRDELPPDAQGWIRNLYGELPRDAPPPRFTRRTVAENVTLLAAEAPAVLAARLREALEAGRYATLRCLGTSSGGAAALAVGALMGAEQAVALGGFHPAREAVWQPAEAALDLFAFDAALRDRPAVTRMTCAFGADHVLDPGRAAGLLKSFPQAIALPIAGVDDHNVLLQLMRRGDLARFLDQAAFGRFAPEDWG